MKNFHLRCFLHTALFVCFATVMAVQYARATGIVKDNFSIDSASSFYDPIMGTSVPEGTIYFAEPNYFASLGANDCPNFIITKAVKLPGGSYQVCVQASNMLSPDHIWEITRDGMSILTGTGATACWTFQSDEPYFVIKHQTEAVDCQISLYIDPSEGLCYEDAVTATVENCHLAANISIDLPYLTDPDFSYVIIFGDGTPAVQSASGEVTHTYSHRGMYNICLSYFIPGTNASFVTCCYWTQIWDCCPMETVQISAPICNPTDATLTFDLPALSFPISVDFGDGTSAVVNSPTVAHEYPSDTCYMTCYTYEPYPNESVKCCERICLPDCCLDPYFQLKLEYSAGTCFNRAYKISHLACPGNDPEVTHHWEFSDGTVFEGPNPPNHLFTNLNVIDGQVCATHTITCCGETASYTACADLMPAAYLGSPGEILHFSDTLPFTNQTVVEFIQEHQSGGDAHPLIIEGTLIADTDGFFLSGTWNMSKDAEILVKGDNTGNYRTLSLEEIVIRSVVRLPSQPLCCRWNGIRSEGLTDIVLASCQIMDAYYGILYAPESEPTGAPFPRLNSTSSQYLNNYYGIKSERQKVIFSEFQDNIMDGSRNGHQSACNCVAINAFDFRDINSPLTIDIVPSYYLEYNNGITHYEQAFHFENTSLKVRGFDIHNLEDYPPAQNVPNNPDGDAGIGIDFRYDRATASSLDLDYIHFSNFYTSGNAKSLAVRDHVWRGSHTLTALAAVAPDNNSISSIKIQSLQNGYELFVGGDAKMDGVIQKNDLSTTTGSGIFDFGIDGIFHSSDNRLIIEENKFFSCCSGNSTNLSALVETDQDFKILNNTFTFFSESSAAVCITNAFNSMVRRNKIKVSGGTTGIRLREGGDGLVDCNDIQGKDLGISVESSLRNRLAGNYLSRNVYDIRFTAGVGGTGIKWNIFRNSQLESIFYEAGAITGTQHHQQFNRWFRHFDENKLIHANPPLAELSQFWYPDGVNLGSELWPVSTPGTFFAADMSGIIDTIRPAGFCTAAGDVFDEPDDSDDPTLTEALLANAGYWAPLTLAEKTFIRQDIYRLLLEHPDWVNANAGISTFMTTYEADFVGQSERLKRGWQLLLQEMADQQVVFDFTRADIELISTQVQHWLEAIHADNTLQDSLSGRISLAIAEADLLIHQLEEADSVFYLTVQNSVGALLLQNAQLEESSWPYWCEKRYNEIALHWLAGIKPESKDTNDLHQIAQLCLKQGGRAVLSARGLCESWLRTPYDEEDCSSIPFEVGVKPETKTSNGLMILPNPAKDVASLMINTQSPQGDWLVQVFNMSGGLVQQNTLAAGTTEWAFSVQDWPSGMYVVRLMNGPKVLSQTFVVQHR